MDLNQIFGMIFTCTWDTATTPANIKAKFHATEIYPLNLSITPAEAFAPSLVTKNEVPAPKIVMQFEIPVVSCLRMNLRMILLY